MSQVKITPWDPDNTVHIDQIYTQLCWLRDDKRPSGVRKDKLPDYSDILKGKTSKPNPNRILVYGRPGIGKSTFAQKISIDWARGKKEILKKFDLLLMIPLRNVCDSETFYQTLKAAKLFPVEDQELVDSLHTYILQHKEKILLVLDGFDEYSTGMTSPIFDIWKGSELRECVVILTTRPIREDEVKRFSNVQFQIKGFDSPQIKEFSMKFLDDQQEVEMFLGYIKKHKLEEIAEIPLLLLMLCLVWKEKDREGLPESKVYLYSDFILALCNHMSAKDTDGTTVSSIESYNAELAQLGELAFNALLENTLEFDFEHLPDQLVNSRLIRVGVIQIVKLFSVRPKKVAAFLHKSIQEFLAAWFVIQKLIPSSSDNLSCMPAIDSTDKAVAMVEVLKFVSEWSLEGSSAVLQHLESLRSQNLSGHHISKTLYLEDLPNDDNKLLELNLECFIATPVSAKAEVYPVLLKSVTGVLVVPDTLLHLTANDHVVKSKVLPNYVFFHFRRRVSQEKCDYMASIMDDLNAIIVTTSGEGKASDFVRKQSNFQVLTSLFLKKKEDKMYLHFSRIAGIDVGTLNELALPTPKVLSQIPHNQLQGDEIATEMRCQTLQHCFSLAKKIDIDELEDEEFVGAISNVMPLVDSPEEITLRSFQESSEPQEIELLVGGMNITECLQRLRLHRIGLTAQSLVCVITALHQASNLQELFLSENPLGSGVSLLAENLQHVHHLTSLELTDVLMEEQAFSDLANSLVHVPQLKVLSVSRNNLGPSITVLADNLYSISGLTHLELSQTQMDEEGAIALSYSLGGLPKLEVLDISHNALGSSVTLITDYLHNTPCLTDLYITDTKMGSDEATAVASSLKYLQNLRMLSVGSNPLNRGVCALVQHLPKNPKLKHLSLTNVKMGEKEVNVVSKACKRTQRVTITTDYHDEKGVPLPAKVEKPYFVRSSKGYYDDYFDEQDHEPDFGYDDNDVYVDENDAANFQEDDYHDEQDHEPDFGYDDNDVYVDENDAANYQEDDYHDEQDHEPDFGYDDNDVYVDENDAANFQEDDYHDEQDHEPDFGYDDNDVYVDENDAANYQEDDYHDEQDHEPDFGYDDNDVYFDENDAANYQEDDYHDEQDHEPDFGYDDNDVYVDENDAANFQEDDYHDVQDHEPDFGYDDNDVYVDDNDAANDQEDDYHDVQDHEPDLGYDDNGVYVDVNDAANYQEDDYYDYRDHEPDYGLDDNDVYVEQDYSADYQVDEYYDDQYYGNDDYQ
ncbi:NLR family CARD domain-containing protein 4-like [Oculina patagonica]